MNKIKFYINIINLQVIILKYNRLFLFEFISTFAS